MYLVVLLTIGFFEFSYAQTQTEDKKEEISIQKTENPVFELGYIEFRLISPYALGSHFLNEAYQQDAAGFEMYLNIYKIYNFRIGIGLSRFGSSLTDASLAGNFERAAYRSYYVQASYAVYQSQVFESGVSLGYGVNYFRQRTRGVRRGSYTTGEIRAGIYSRYQLAENFGVSFGANYLTTNKNIENASLSDDLFGSTHVVYMYLGFYFNL